LRLPLAAFALALAAAGCSPGPEPEHEAQSDRVEAKVETAAANEAAGVAPTVAAAPVAEPAKGVRRCGWLSNPTPGNWWLTDRDGQWVLGTQGADQAPGMEETPDMSTAGWVETNGHYGYGCACMTITADSDGQVTRVADAEPKPLKQCRADRKLPKPD
jgi:hypothetical protein